LALAIVGLILFKDNELID